MNVDDLLDISVNKMEYKLGKELVDDPKIKKIMKIVEQFLKDKKRMCYGGTAINNVLPINKQFYDKKVDLPDYDFFSPDPLNDAKELADIYFKKGYINVSAISASHGGTFKVFVNFIPIADISYMHNDKFNLLMKTSIVKKNIHYSPINFLRMLMYLELSRPKGDIQRWRKVYDRLLLLNSAYPLKFDFCKKKNYEDIIINNSRKNYIASGLNDGYYGNIINTSLNVFSLIKNFLIKEKCVFFGGYALYFYLKNIFKQDTYNIPDFDILSTNPKNTSNDIKKLLEKNKYTNINIIEKPGIGETIAPHYQIFLNNISIIFIYKPLACHSYNIIKYKNQNIHIASIETMFSFYLAFLYTDRPYYDEERISCLCDYLFKSYNKKKINDIILKKFSITCYGDELSTKEKRKELKNKKYLELSKKKKTNEWEWWFLNYSPVNNNKKTKKNKYLPKNEKSRTRKTKKKTKTDDEWILHPYHAEK